MTDASGVLGRIAAANTGNALRQDRAQLTERMRAHGINLMPARADIAEPERLQLFLDKCAELLISVTRLESADDAPEAIADWLSQNNLPATARIAPSDAVAGLPWDRTPLMTVETGPAGIDDQVSVTTAVAGIAETGTLVLESAAVTPMTLNFVPDNHIVMLKRSQVMRAMEDAFASLRQRHGEGQMPRTVTLVSGPSRTGDVEQKLVVGAHGPRRVHLLLIDDVENGHSGSDGQ